MTLWKGHPIHRGGPHPPMVGVDTWPGHREGQLEHMPSPTAFREWVRPSHFREKRPKEPYPVPSPKQSIPVVLSHTLVLLVALSLVISINVDGLKSKGQINLHHHRRDPRGLPSPFQYPVACLEGTPEHPSAHKSPYPGRGVRQPSHRRPCGDMALSLGSSPTEFLKDTQCPASWALGAEGLL